jgi:hypothetical protein
VSSPPPDNQGSGGFNAFLQKTRQTLASFSPSAPKPKISCPESKPEVVEVNEPPEVVARAQPKPPVKLVSIKEPEPWRLTVLVKCVDRRGQTDTQHVPEATVQVFLKRKQGSAESLSIEKDDFGGGIGQTKLSKRRRYDVSATGHTEYEVSAAVEKWKMVKAKTVVLDDGDKKEVTIEIRRLAWVQFEVVDVGGTPIPGVTLDLVLPARPNQQEVTKDKDPVRIEDLEDGKARIEALTYGTDVWEVVDVTHK